MGYLGSARPWGQRENTKMLEAHLNSALAIAFSILEQDMKVQVKHRLIIEMPRWYQAVRSKNVNTRKKPEWLVCSL